MDIIIETSDPQNPIKYTGTIIASNSSQLQTWKLLKNSEGELLFIDNQLQSCNNDETLYHEMFVHSLMTGCKNDSKVLILGGSEGCMIREVLKWPIHSVTQVDWDESIVSYFKNNGLSWNNKSYDDPRVTSIISDAYIWLMNCQEKYDYIFIDLLDPLEQTSDIHLNILKQAKRCLSEGGNLSINAGVVRHTYTPACSLADTMKNIFVDSNFVALRVSVPSFKEEWCFLMVTNRLWSYRINENLPDGLKYYTRDKLISSVRWSDKYPHSISSFWKDGPKKLVQESRGYQIDFVNQYGC
jgi:spermidine synthase